MLKQFLEKIWSGGNSPNDSELYAVVYSELTRDEVDPGLWTKAVALADGNIERARSKYIQMRVGALSVERRLLVEHERRALESRERLQRASAEAVQRQQELQEIRCQLSSIQSKLWERYASPEAISRKRKLAAISASVLGSFVLIAYLFLSNDDGIMLVAVFAVLIFYIIVTNDGYDKAELEAKKRDLVRDLVRRERDLK